MLKELAGARDRMVALDDEEDSEDVICIGAPVFDHLDRCVAAISITGLKQTLRSELLDQLEAAVRRHAQTLSHRLGHNPETEGAA